MSLPSLSPSSGCPSLNSHKICSHVQFEYVVGHKLKRVHGAKCGTTVPGVLLQKIKIPWQIRGFSIMHYINLQSTLTLAFLSHGFYDHKTWIS